MDYTPTRDWVDKIQGRVARYAGDTSSAGVILRLGWQRAASFRIDCMFSDGLNANPRDMIAPESAPTDHNLMITRATMTGRPSRPSRRSMRRAP